VITAAVLVGLVAATAAATYAAQSHGGAKSRQIALRDDCDPNDPGWDVVPGDCLKKRGTVSAAEFDAELNSPLSDAVIGHPSWRIDRPYLVVKEGATLKVKNKGGRPHTFTEVAQWGGGVVPPLSGGLDTAPECAALAQLDPGEKAKLSGLAVGNHRFLCCFHPWMRAVVKVKPKHHGKHDD
jgi:hypothetical protein